MTLQKIQLSEISEKTNLFQSKFWADFKSAFGWNAQAFIYDNSTIIALYRKIKGFGWIYYIPHGLAGLENADLAGLSRELVPLLDNKPFVLRYDLPWEKPLPEPTGLKKAASDIQVPSTIMLDLSVGEDALLSAMKQKTRYNTRLAGKKGVEIYKGGYDDIETWYNLYKITSERDKISIHSLKYYQEMFRLSEKYENITFKIYLAKHEEDILAGIIVAEHGKRATYLFGASCNVKRNLMPAYALQWQAISEAIAAGCSEYDMFGIPESDDPKDPMHGLYRFKTGFGGTIIHRLGCWDYPVNKAVYSLFRTGEKLRKFYYKVWKKR